MKSREDYCTAKEKILQITKELKSHYNQGEFFDHEKNFNHLLEKIIVLLYFYLLFKFLPNTQLLKF